MGLGKKDTYTGMVTRKRINVGSKSEHEAVVINVDGVDMKLRINGGNPFHDPALDAFVGKRVKVEGVAGSGVPFIMVDSVADIVVLGPPGRPSRPPAPKM